MVRHILLQACAISALGLYGNQAIAAAESASSSTGASNASTLGEVVVTAQKREEKLQKVPISMEVVSGDKLEKSNIHDIRGMVKLTPNVVVVTSPGNDAIYIRGFGSNPGNYSFDASVSLYEDGIYAGRSKQAQEPFFDLARVEVLRGPQGALFGKNTAAGAISIVSAGPTNTFEAGGRASYNFDMKGPELEGYVSGPVNNKLGVRLALKYVDQDGYLDNLNTGQRDPSNRSALGRLTVRYAPTSNFDYTFKAEYANKLVHGSNNVSQDVNAPADPRDFRYTESSIIGDEGQKETSWLLSGTGNLQLGNFTLTSVTGYSWYRASMNNAYDLVYPRDGITREQALAPGGLVQNGLFQNFPDHFEQVSQEVRLLSPLGHRFEYVIGGYYDTSRYTVSEIAGFNINVPSVLVYSGSEQSFFNQREQSYSVFGQGTFHATDRLRAIGSLRYTHTSKRADYYGELLSGPFPLQPITSAVGRISEDHVDPSGTIQYDLASRVMLYATYGRGSKSGGFVSNNFGTTNSTFAFLPEKSKNYEVGEKSTLFDGRLVLDVSLYDTKFTDLQVSTFNGNTNTFVTSNAASASSKGVEASTAWYPIRNLDVTGSVAYEHAKFDNYPGGACLASETLAQCNPLVPASILANNIAGSKLPFVPDLSYSVQGHYRLDTPHETALDTTVGLNGRSKIFTSTDLSPLYGLQKAYVKIDARVQFGPKNERWYVAVVGKNLTNELTQTTAYFFPFPISNPSRAMLHLEETRNVAIEAGAKF